MPLDFWIAQTDTFASIVSPSPAGAMVRGEVSSALDAVSQVEAPNDDRWVIGSTGESIGTAETIAVGPRDVVRLGVSMAAPGFEQRCRAAHDLVRKLAESLDAAAFEATAGRRVLDVPSTRWLDKRIAESEQTVARLAPNGLAPLEFPVENLDAVANPLTLILPDKRAVAPSGFSREPDSNVLRWDWERVPFQAALAQLTRLLLANPELDGVILDARQVTADLIDTLTDRNDAYLASYYLWWRDRREDLPNA